MAISNVHAFASAIADDAAAQAAGEVLPSHWNAEHTLTCATGKLLGRTTPGTGAVEEVTPGTGVLTALQVNVGSAGAFVTFNGALGTPSSGTLTNATGLPAAGVVGTAAVLGANTFTATQTMPSGTLAGAISAAAWTTTGIGLIETARTLTDTSSSGTVAAVYTHKLGGNTMAASSATTYTDAYTAYLAEPVAGTNVTLTRKWTLGLAGRLQVGAGAAATPSVSFVGAVDGLFSRSAGAAIGLSLSGLPYYDINTVGFYIRGNYIGMVNGDPGASLPVSAWRLTSNVMQQINAASKTTSQTLRVTGTYTDDSNYEWAALSATAGSGITLAAETAGTGGDNLNVTLTPAGTGGVVIGANYQQLSEMTAPAAGAANTVRLFAQDNGAGKTQLMAIFNTGGAVQVAIEP